MKKTINVLHNKEFKFCSHKFKEDEITKILIINEKVHNSYRDSLSGGLYGYDTQCMQINVYVNTSDRVITFALWGFDYRWSKAHIDMEKERFKEWKNFLLSNCTLGTEVAR